MTLPRSPPKYPITSRSCSDREKNTEAALPPLPDSAAGIFLGLGDKAGKHRVLPSSKTGAPDSKSHLGKKPPLPTAERSHKIPQSFVGGKLRDLCGCRSLRCFPTPCFAPKSGVKHQKKAWIVPPNMSRDEKQREKRRERLLPARKPGHMFRGYKSLR